MNSQKRAVLESVGEGSKGPGVVVGDKALSDTVLQKRTT